MRHACNEIAKESQLLLLLAVFVSCLSYQATQKKYFENNGLR